MNAGKNGKIGYSEARTSLVERSVNCWDGCSRAGDYKDRRL